VKLFLEEKKGKLSNRYVNKTGINLKGIAAVALELLFAMDLIWPGGAS